MEMAALLSLLGCFVVVIYLFFFSDGTVNSCILLHNKVVLKCRLKRVKSGPGMCPDKVPLTYLTINQAPL